MNEEDGTRSATDARRARPSASPGKPMSPQPHIEGSGQREDARRHGEDEFDSDTNIIAADRVPKHTAEADRARVARTHGRVPPHSGSIGE